MELTVNYLGNFQFEAETRGLKVLCDQPVEDQGDNEAMTPTELFVASLATCSAYYAVYYLKTRNLPKDGLKVKVNAEKASGPARISKFQIRVELPGISDPQHIEGVRRSVAKCLVKNTLMMAPEFEVEIEGFEADKGQAAE
ncbi:MAG: OsmC family protein [Bryobacteraceae bacterium]|nr:OsmC family protein [Bryobacteraceae bacterium]